MNARDYLNRESEYEFGLTDRETIDILTNIFLGENYCIIDPVTGIQANEIIVEDIIDKRKKAIDNAASLNSMGLWREILCLGIGIAIGLMIF